MVRVFMVNWMAIRETSELGGKGVVVCPKGLISWVFTSVLGECGVMVRWEAIISLVTRAHICRAVVMWGRSIREMSF